MQGCNRVRFTHWHRGIAVQKKQNQGVSRRRVGKLLQTFSETSLVLVHIGERLEGVLRGTPRGKHFLNPSLQPGHLSLGIHPRNHCRRSSYLAAPIFFKNCRDPAPLGGTVLLNPNINQWQSTASSPAITRSIVALADWREYVIQLETRHALCGSWSDRLFSVLDGRRPLAAAPSLYCP